MFDGCNTSCLKVGSGGRSAMESDWMLTFCWLQIAKAVDHCDNDKIKTIKYLNKLKGKVRPSTLREHTSKRSSNEHDITRNNCIGQDGNAH